MGGGTGTGAAPVVASIAREMGILTIAIVTKPLVLRGKREVWMQKKGLKMKEVVDTLIVIPNDKIYTLVDKKLHLSKLLLWLIRYFISEFREFQI